MVHFFVLLRLRYLLAVKIKYLHTYLWEGNLTALHFQKGAK